MFDQFSVLLYFFGWLWFSSFVYPTNNVPFSPQFLDVTFISDSSNVFLVIFMFRKKYSRMLIVGSGNCFPTLVMQNRIFVAGPAKPTGMVRTIICPGKTFSPFNCEGKLAICYSTINNSWTSGSRIKNPWLFLACLNSWWFRIRIGRVALGFNRF